MPSLISYLEHEKIDVLYYNTKQDQDNNKKNMDRILESIPVTSIPLILVIDNQEISAIFMGEHIVDELREYMSGRSSN